MLVLALDTTLVSCSAAVFDSAAGHVLAAEQQLMDKGHAEAIAPMVQRVLAKAGVRPGDLQRVAVTTGPGTFTGQRIGLALAHGMGVALGCEVVGLDTLTATAAPLLSRLSNLLVVHQAGATGKFYAARFANGVLASELLFDELDALIAGLGTTLHQVMGTGADAAVTLAPNVFKRIAGHDLPVAESFIAHSAAMSVQKGYPQPIYLHEPDAKPSPGFKPETIRLAEAADLAALSALHRMCFEHGWSEESLKASLSLPGAMALTAERDGKIRAFLLVQQAADEAEIITLCAEPRWRRRALSERLLTAALDLLRHQKVRILHLEVAADNTAALALYGKLGFSINGRRKGYYERGAAAGVDAVMMSRAP